MKKLLLVLNEIYRFIKRKCRRLTGVIVRSHTLKAYFSSHQVHKLQIGAGANILEGWLNTNEAKFSSLVIFLDATRAFPFEDCSFDYIFSEHQIEHLTFREGLFMLHECFRVMKPGGGIRIATPDLETLIGLHAAEKNELQKRYLKWIMDAYFPDIDLQRESFVINNAFYNWEHRFLYDSATLQDSMEKSGFINIIRYPMGHSDDHMLRGLEHHGQSVDNEEMIIFETMVLEGKRPR